MAPPPDHVRSIGGTDLVRTSRRLARRAFHLYRLARPTEWVGVTGFFARSAAIKAPLGHRQTSLRLQGNRYWVGYSTGEVSALIEVLDGAYEKLPDFRPRAGWTIIDAGANVGAFAVHAAGLGAHVYAFEPNPTCFRRLTAAAKPLGIGCFEVALGAVRGQARLIADSAGWTTKGFIAADGAGYMVDVARLDDLISTIGDVDLVKLDVEGSEAAVLQGASRVLHRVQRLVLEFHSDELLDQCQELLAGAGLRPALIDRHPWRNARPGIGYAYFQR